MVDHATSDGNQCLRMLATYLTDGLAAFLVAGVGDGAGVHDEDVGDTVALGNLIPRRLEPRCQSIGLIEVDTATESFEGDGFVHFNYFALQN